MCGIAGLLSFRADAAAWTCEIEQSLAVVARRGPDDRGAWSDGATCLLDFRRLSVLDLTPAGHQPMVCPAGGFALVCNGEIYNFRELRRALERDGARFRSAGDTEVVLHALARWGPDALARFNGMFALAFYDAMAERLLLARGGGARCPAAARVLFHAKLEANT